MQLTAVLTETAGYSLTALRLDTCDVVVSELDVEKVYSRFVRLVLQSVVGRYVILHLEI